MSGAPGSFAELPAMQIRCPHCHHPIEVVDEKLFEALACPSCGSNITLISKDTTVAHEPTSDGNTVALKPRRLGHFELLEQVGVGGFGAVWKARDTVLDRIVAVKVPRRSQLTSAEAEYFLRDARAAAQLRHPNIVSVHEVGRDGETYFIASDFVDGANLHEWLSARKLTVREAAELVAQIAEAVHHAHERGVVHRDLKLGNILMDSAGRPHVTDFGLAKRETGEITMTVDGQILGTPAYMSPEQARGKAHEADAKSDVYSLGVILFELLTGELPFRGEKRMLIMQILNDEPPSPRKLNSRVPRDLETICLKCLRKEPRRRYESARDVRDDLKRFLHGKPISARPINRTERMRKWIGRHPAVALTSSLLVVVTLLGLATTTWLWRSAQHSLNTSQVRQYSNQIALANLEFLGGERGRGYGWLRQCERDRRSWEWRYLKRQCTPILAQCSAPSVPNDITVSGDGRLIATAHNNEAVLWDAMTGKRISSLNHDYAVASLCFDADGTRLATTSGQFVTIWDVRSGTKVRTRERHSTDSAKALITGDGTRVLYRDEDASFVLWQVSDGTTVAEFPLKESRLDAFVLSPDDRHFAFSQSGNVTVVDISTAQIVGEFPIDGSGLAYSSDSERLATTEGVWNTKTGSRVATFQNESHFDDVAYCPAGNRFALIGMISNRGGTGGGGTAVTFVAPNNGSLLNVIELSQYMFGRIEFSNNGRVGLLAKRDLYSQGTGTSLLHEDRQIVVFDGWIGSNPMLLQNGVLPVDVASTPTFVDDVTLPIVDIVPSASDRYLAVRGQMPADNALDQELEIRRPGELTVFDMDTGSSVLKVQCGRPRRALAISPDGQKVATSGPGRLVTIYDLQSGKVLLTLKDIPADTRAMAFRDDGGTIATASDDHTIRIWDAGTGKQQKQLAYEGGLLDFISFQHAGKFIAGSDLGDITEYFANDVRWSTGDVLKVWDLDTDEVIKLDAVVGVFDRTGSRLLSVDRAGAFNWYDVHSWQSTATALRNLEFVNRSIPRIFLSEDNNWLAAPSAGRLKIMNLNRDGMRDIYCGDLTALAFGPKRRLAWGARHEGSIHTVDLETGQDRHFKAHDDGICALGWTTDGRHLVSGSFDHTVKVWDTSSWMMERELGESPCGHAVAWHPSRDALAVAGWDNVVRIWNVPAGRIETVLPAFDGRIRDICWSPNGLQIAAVGSPGSVVIWNVSERALSGTLDSGSSTLLSVEWSPDGTKLATQSIEGEVIVWDSPPANEIARFESSLSHESSFLNWSTDSRLLASAESSRGIAINDVLHLKTAGHFNNGSTLAWQPGRARAAVAGAEQVSLIDLNTMSQVWEFRRMSAARSPDAFTSDGKRLIAARGSSVVVLNADTGEELLTLRDSQEKAAYREVEKWISFLCLNHSGDMLFTGANDGTVRCYNASLLKRRNAIPASDLDNRAAVILTGRVVSAGSNSRTTEFAVEVESIEKDDSEDLVIGDVIGIRVDRDIQVSSGFRARFYLSTKSAEDWLPVPEGEAFEILDETHDPPEDGEAGP